MCQLKYIKITFILNFERKNQQGPLPVLIKTIESFNVIEPFSVHPYMCKVTRIKEISSMNK